METPEYTEVANFFNSWQGKKKLHPYAKSIQNRVLDTQKIVESFQLNPQEEVKIMWEVHRKLAQFYVENCEIANSQAQLWESVGGDKDKYCAILESVPPNRISALGYFINRDPKQFSQNLVNPRNQKRIEMLTLRAMFSTFVHQNPPEVKITEDEIDKEYGLDTCNNFNFIQLTKGLVTTKPKLVAQKLFEKYCRFLRTEGKIDFANTSLPPDFQV